MHAGPNAFRVVSTADRNSPFRLQRVDILKHLTTDEKAAGVGGIEAYRDVIHSWPSAVFSQGIGYTLQCIQYFVLVRHACRVHIQ